MPGLFYRIEPQAPGVGMNLEGVAVKFLGYCERHLLYRRFDSNNQPALAGIFRGPFQLQAMELLPFPPLLYTSAYEK